MVLCVREEIEPLLRSARKIHQHHADDETGMAVSVARDDDAVAMDFFTFAAVEVHGHFGPEGKSFFRAELEAIFSNANAIGGEGELCPIFRHVERLENPRGI